MAGADGADAFDTIGCVTEDCADRGRTLAKVAIFSGLTDAELRFLADRAVPRQFAPGEMLFAEGDACAGLYVVERGNVRIFKTSASGREQVLSIDGPGSSVAEVPVLDGAAIVGILDESDVLLAASVAVATR